MAEVRDRLTQQFGFTWVQTGKVDVSPERNGYGGESMLQKYTSTVWTTEQPVQDTRRKRDVMRVVNQVLAENGMSDLYALNEPGVMPFEIVGLEEEADPAARLVADRGGLRVAVRFGKEQPAAAGARDAHPALAAAERGVRHQV